MERNNLLGIFSFSSGCLDIRGITVLSEVSLCYLTMGTEKPCLLVSYLQAVHLPLELEN